MSEDGATDLQDLFFRAVSIWRRATNASEYAGIWPILDQGAELWTDEAVRVGLHFLKSSKAENRAIAVDLLGRVAAAHPDRRESVATALLELLHVEEDVDVQWSILTALRWTEFMEATPALAAWLKADSKDMRVQAVLALAQIHSGGRHTEPGLIALMNAMSDEDEDVRSWATLAVGTKIEIDNQLVRDALSRRLFDTDDTTRLEAIIGLSIRKDQRAIEAVKQALMAATPARRVFEAAGILGMPELLPYLHKADRTHVPDDVFQDVLILCGEVVENPGSSVE